MWKQYMHALIRTQSYSAISHYLFKDCKRVKEPYAHVLLSYSQRSRTLGILRYSNLDTKCRCLHKYAHENGKRFHLHTMH